MNVKDYIEHVYILEKSCYEQQLLMGEIKRYLRQAHSPNYMEFGKTSSSLIGDVMWGILFVIFFSVIGGIGAFILMIIAGILSILLELLNCIFNAKWLTAFIKFFNVADVKFFLVVLIVCIIIGFVLGISVSICSIKSGHRDRKNILIGNRHAKAENERILANSHIRISTLEAQLQKTNTFYNQTRTTLNRFYSMNVIFPKYRSFVPMAMFCEYFESGRCNQLEGHEGAYNLYEQEIRMNLILVKLDEIIRRLDQIENNQYVLAHAVQEANQNANYIGKVVSNCADTLQSIDTNTQLSSYFSEVSAINTTYLAWLGQSR